MLANNGSYCRVALYELDFSLASGLSRFVEVSAVCVHCVAPRGAM